MPRVRTSSSSEPSLGKNPTVSSLILSSLAGGEKHGYALVKDVQAFAGVRVPPETLAEHLKTQRQIVNTGLRRLRVGWSLTRNGELA